MFINFLRNEKLNIVALSSYPTQIGFLVAHKFHLENKNFSSKKYLIFLYPTRTDKFLNNQANLIKYLNSFSKNEEIEIDLIIIKNIYIRFLAYLKLLFLGISKRKKDIILWQPRYLFLEDTFSFKNNLIRLPFKEFNTILFGDGFLNFMPTNKPFWLSKNKKRKNLYINKKNLIASYHSFNLSNNKIDIQSIEIPSEYISKCLEDYLKSKFDEKLNLSLKSIKNQIMEVKGKKLKIYIFPLTTFYETGRASLSDEVDMYIKFLKKSSLKEFQVLIIKAHPGNENIKIESFLKRIKEEKFFKFLKIISNEYIADIFPLERIPLELLIKFLYLEKEMISLKLDICITCSSTATLSTKIVNKDCDIEFAFGERLIRKFLKKEYIEKRLIQEKYLEEKIKDININ